MSEKKITVEFQVNKPNGDIDFIEYCDLPPLLAFRHCEKLYPRCEIELYKTNYVYQGELEDLRIKN